MRPPTEGTTDDDATTVLVVDDDADLADTYTLWLDREGYEVRTAYRGDAALGAAEGANVIVLDRRMPAIPGDEVARTLRDRDGQWLVVGISAVSPDEGLVDLPVDDYLVKPVTRATVVEAVDRQASRLGVAGPRRRLHADRAKLRLLRDHDEGHLADARERLRDRMATLRERIDGEDLDGDAVLDRPPG
jgi:DNA-binding response OmpR family regulator